MALGQPRILPWRPPSGRRWPLSTGLKGSIIPSDGFGGQLEAGQIHSVTVSKTPQLILLCDLQFCNIMQDFFPTHKSRVVTPQVGCKRRSAKGQLYEIVKTRNLILSTIDSDHMISEEDGSFTNLQTVDFLLPPDHDPTNMPCLKSRSMVPHYIHTLHYILYIYR